MIISIEVGFPRGSAVKESACNVGNLGLISGLGRSPGEGKVYPLLYSGLENSMGCIVHGVTKSRIQLNNFHIHFTFIWASLIGQSVKNLRAVQETRVRSLVRKIAWRRKWQPTPVFLPGESHRQRSLAGYGPQHHRVTRLKRLSMHAHNMNNTKLTFKKINLQLYYNTNYIMSLY